MRKFTTLIMAGGRGERLFPLTRNRAKPAIRFGGIYRLIDFTLSNCINSGIKKIYLLTQYASTSLERHIRFGWTHYFRPEFDEFIETRPPQQFENDGWYRGTVDSVLKNIEILQQEMSDGVLILSGDHIYKMDYRKMIDFHFEQKADLTIACVDLPKLEAKNLGVVGIDENHNVISFSEKPEEPLTIPNRPDFVLCNMGVYFFNLNTLIEVLHQDKNLEMSQHDFGRNIIPKMIYSSARVVCYQFWDENKKQSKYWRDIGTIDALYEANIDLIEIDPLFNLYDNEWPMKCYLPQLPPSKTVFNWENENRIGLAVDSLLSLGVIISGGRVARSILSPNVRVHSHAKVSNSILFDNVEVGRGAYVNNAIVDEGVFIPAGFVVGTNLEEDKDRFFVSEKGIRIITSSP